MPHAHCHNSTLLDASDEPPSAVSIDIRIDSGMQRAVDVHWLSQRLQQAAALLAQTGVALARVSVLIVNDARMLELHRRHANLATTTDVLTFDLRGDSSQPIDVDIVVCADEAARRAAELGHPLERELLLYSVHGLLHCAGHDDHDDEAWRRMHAREDEILSAIGVGATFEPRAGDRREGQEPRA
jgi:probable rRNA maturation factor